MKAAKRAIHANIRRSEIAKGTCKMRNPLHQSSQPFRLPDFPAIRPAHVLPALENLLESYRSGVEDWLKSGSQPGWAMVEAELAWADDLSRAFFFGALLIVLVDNVDFR